MNCKTEEMVCCNGSKPYLGKCVFKGDKIIKYNFKKKLHSTFTEQSKSFSPLNAQMLKV